MRLAMRIGTGPLQAGLADRVDSPVLAIYSSALANVYFTDVPHRMDLSEVESRAPGLLEALASHRGVGLVVVRSGDKTALLHAGGRILLEDATRDEIAFLGLYDDPELVRAQLLQLAAMRCAGDLLVFGAFDGVRVVNFEDHGGAHGGLGGVQQFPFMVSPRGVRHAFESIVDATELHGLFAERYRLNGKRVGKSAPPSVSDLPEIAAG
jgi:hypothetical protein